MFSNIRNIISRHSRKLVVSGVIISGLICILKYNQHKINKWQREEARHILQRSRRSQHFESTERSCTQTIMNLAGSIRVTILKSLDSDTVINNLKNDSCNKITAWNQLKVLSISKSVAIIYAHVMFIFTIRIQLNLISANMFKNSQKTDEKLEFDESIQEKYLTLCSYFMDHGIYKLTEFISQKVEEIVGPVSLSNKLSLKDLEQLHWSIMSSILADDANNPIKNLSKYMLPTNIDNTPNDSMNKIMNVTVDLLESDEVQSLMQSCVRSGFVLLIDRVSTFYCLQQFDKCAAADSITKNALSNNDAHETNCTEAESYFNLNEITIPMAKLIPILNGQLQNSPSSHDIHFEWLQNLISDEKLKTFSANIYEAFSF